MNNNTKRLSYRALESDANWRQEEDSILDFLKIIKFGSTSLRQLLRTISTSKHSFILLFLSFLKRLIVCATFCHKQDFPENPDEKHALTGHRWKEDILVRNECLFVRHVLWNTSMCEPSRCCSVVWSKAVSHKTWPMSRDYWQQTII